MKDYNYVLLNREHLHAKNLYIKKSVSNLHESYVTLEHYKSAE